MAKKKEKKNRKDKTSAVNQSVEKKVVKTARPSVSAKTSSASTQLAFGKENYKWIGIGLALITIGMLLMIGGYNENPAVWDESEIYSMRRILLAPIVILTGLAIQVYAIFK